MPLMRPTLKMPPASQAPVEPADTAAWASPFFSCIMATTMEEAVLRRIAMVGLSWLEMLSGASTIDSRSVS